MKLKIYLFIVFLISGAAAQQLVEAIEAVVGNEIILKTEVDQFTQNYIVQNRINVKNNDALLKSIRQKTLESLIEQKLLLEKAVLDTVTVDDQLLDQKTNERLQYLVQQVGSEEKLEEVFGSPMKQIKKETRKIVKEQLLVQQVRQKQFMDITVSRREVEEFYKTYKDSLPPLQGTVKISHILKIVAPSDEAQQAALDKIKNIKEQLTAGANFEELAKKYSEDPGSAQRGGDLGFVGRGDFVPEYEQAAFELKDGEVSDIVQSTFGFHIIKMVERRGEKIHTKHILIQTVPTKDDELRTINELKEIRRRLLNGADWDSLALAYSDDENVVKDHGHLGVFEIDKLVIPAFKQVVDTLKVGEISEPFKTEFGYHIVRLDDRQDKRRMDLEHDWDRIEMFAKNYKIEKEYRKWIVELKKQVPIQINTI
jgi:peptidyl-prolyl cis-trans isomerase SurA